MRTAMLTGFAIITAALFAAGAALAQTDTRTLSTDMLREVLKHSVKDFNDSALSGFYPRMSIGAGLGEKIANKLWEENGDTLGFMLTESAQPSGVSGNPYVNLTKNQSVNGRSYEELLADRITSAGGELGPDQVLGLALDVTGGDYWLATLAAHNLLKEVAYASRSGQIPLVGWDPDNPNDATKWKLLKSDDILGKLRQLRAPGDPHVKDKIGPWYHMYGLFFVGGMLSGDEADFMAGAENLTRKLGLGSSSDPFKEDMNVWAANLTHALNELVDKGVCAPADLSLYSRDELQAIFDKLREQHRSYQGELEVLNSIMQADPYFPNAEWRMDVIRDIQKSLYQEALRVRGELNSRPQ